MGRLFRFVAVVLFMVALVLFVRSLTHEWALRTVECLKLGACLLIVGLVASIKAAPRPIRESGAMDVALTSAVIITATIAVFFGTGALVVGGKLSLLALAFGGMWIISLMIRKLHPALVAVEESPLPEIIVIPMWRTEIQRRERERQLS